MKFRKKITKGLAMSMALSMLFCNTAFATEIDLVNSTESVTTDTLNKSEGTDHFADEENEWQDGTINEEVRVTVDLASQFTITIPKEIILNGEDGTAQYKVKAVGDIAGDQTLTVVPEPDFILSEAGGKSDVTATVVQPNTEYVYTDLQGDGTEYDGSIAATLTAGEWSGKFNFNIEFDGGETSSLPEAGQPLESYSWDEIAAISEAGEVANYFSVGDEKSIIVNNKTYTAQIIGINHDYLSDNSERAGITFQFKEYMEEVAIKANSTATNAGGWEASEMRSYVNTTVFNMLPTDLQNVIKKVNKISDTGTVGNGTLVTTEDKIFLPSLEEVGLSDSGNITGQGEKYEYFSDNASRTKYNTWVEELMDGQFNARWQLRSSHSEFDDAFYYVGDSGYTSFDSANLSNPISPCFCV